jgi:hypothetical protein
MRTRDVVGGVILVGVLGLLLNGAKNYGRTSSVIENLTASYNPYSYNQYTNQLDKRVTIVNR